MAIIRSMLSGCFNHRRATECLPYAQLCRGQLEGDCTPSYTNLTVPTGFTCMQNNYIGVTTIHTIHVHIHCTLISVIIMTINGNKRKQARLAMLSL